MPIQLSGSLVITGSITTTGVITMSGSIASASYSSNSDLLQGTGSVGFTTTASFNAVSASQQQISASYIALSASYNTFSGSASTRITENSSSIQQVSSSQQQISASLLNVIAIGATTGSNSFRATQSITGSLTVTGQIIAQTINVQQVTSSIIYSSGSNVFGCDLNSRQTFTGSVLITGSLTIAGGSSATSYSAPTIFGSTIACSPIGCFATSCATSFIGGTMSGTTIYGSTAVCSAVGLFSGCVGIGTNSPITRLQVIANTPTYLYNPGQLDVRTQENQAANKGAMISIGGNSIGNNTPYNFGIIGAYKTNSTSEDYSSYMIFGTSDVYSNVFERMRITTGGNVGINCSAPSYKLHVGGTIGGYFAADGDNIASFINTASTYTYGVGGVFIGSSTANNCTNLSGGSGALIIRNGASTYTAAIAYNGQAYFCGNVGIGTASPSYRLQVEDTNPRIRIKATSTGYAINYLENDSGTSQMFIDNSIGGGFAYGNYTRGIYNTGAYDFIIATNATERMRITACGTVKTQCNQALGALETSGTIANNSCVSLNLNSAGGNASIGFIAIGAARTDTTACQAVRLFSQSHTNGYNTYTSIQGINDGGITITNNANGGEIIYNCSGATANYVVRYINLISLNSIFERQ